MPQHRAAHHHRQPEMLAGKVIQLHFCVAEGRKRPFYRVFHLGDVGNGFLIDFGFNLNQRPLCAVGQGVSGPGHGSVDAALELAVAVAETADLLAAVAHELTDAVQSGVDPLAGLVLLFYQCVHLLALAGQGLLQHAVFQFQLVQVADGLPGQDLRLVVRRGAARL